MSVRGDGGSHAFGRSFTPGSGRGDDWPFMGTGGAGGGRMAAHDRVALARRIQHFCALRQDSFGTIIHDAPFNLLIDMYLSEQAHRRVTVGDACLASRAPQTTALRAIRALVDAGIVRRSDDTSDSRRKFLSLTSRGRDKVSRFIDRFAEDGGF